MLDTLAIAPAVQAIVVNSVTVVDPQLASIIGDDAKPVMAGPADSQMLVGPSEGCSECWLDLAVGFGP